MKRLFLFTNLNLSHRSVTMADCTRAFVRDENYGFSQVGKGSSQTAFA